MVRKIRAGLFSFTTWAIGDSHDSLLFSTTFCTAPWGETWETVIESLTMALWGPWKLITTIEVASQLARSGCGSFKVPWMILDDGFFMVSSKISFRFSDGTSCEPAADCLGRRIAWKHVCPSNPFNPDDVSFQPVNLWIVLLSSFHTSHHLNRLYTWLHYRGHEWS